MSLVFATDVDSVLLDISTNLENALNELYAEEFNERGYDATNFMQSQVGIWDLSIAFGLSKNEMTQVWEKAFSTPNLPYDGAIAFVQRLKGLGYKVIGVTKRGGKLFEEPALRDLPQLGLDDVIFVRGHKEEKGPVVKTLNADVFVDDKIANVLSVAEHCPLTSLYLMDQPWNNSLDIRVPYMRVWKYSQILKDVAV